MEPITMIGLAVAGFVALRARNKAETSPDRMAMRISPSLEQTQVTEFETEIVEEGEIVMEEVAAFAPESVIVEQEEISMAYVSNGKEVGTHSRFRGEKKGHLKRYDDSPYALNPYMISNTF